MWARQAGCPVVGEALGGDYGAAVSRAETVLLPAFNSWRSGGATDKAQSAGARSGTLDWVFAQYRGDRRFTCLDAKTRRTHELGFRLVGGYVLKDGRRLGQALLSSINTAITDLVYQKGRRRHRDGCRGQCDRAQADHHDQPRDEDLSSRVERRLAGQPRQGAADQPVRRHGASRREPPDPDRDLRRACGLPRQGGRDGLPVAGDRALIGWEFLQREEDIFGSFDAGHYRPKEHPDAVHVVHEKTHEEAWVPLVDDVGAALYPELMAELDALKRERIGGLMLRRDWGDRLPWPTDKGGLTLMRHKVKAVIRAAGLRDELTFTSFRHGGFTEAANSDLTDAEIRAQGRHESARVLPRYAKRTMNQVAAGARKRRATRTKAGDLSE